MFTEVFVEILEKRNITPYQVAKNTGISQGLMGEYNRGEKLPTTKNLIKIADYLDCSVDYLLGRSDKSDMVTSINNSNTVVKAPQFNVANVKEEPNDERSFFMPNTFWNTFETLCSNIGKKPNPVGKEIGVASSTIAKWKSGTIPNGETLIEIANYFKCSTDYLLGRVDTPNGTYSISNRNTTVNGTQANVINSNTTEKKDCLIEEFMQKFKELPFEEKVDVMQYVSVKMKKSVPLKSDID